LRKAIKSSKSPGTDDDISSVSSESISGNDDEPVKVAPSASVSGGGDSEPVKVAAAPLTSSPGDRSSSVKLPPRNPSVPTSGQDSKPKPVPSLLSKPAENKHKTYERAASLKPRKGAQGLIGRRGGHASDGVAPADQGPSIETRVLNTADAVEGGLQHRVSILRPVADISERGEEEFSSSQPYFDSEPPIERTVYLISTPSRELEQPISLQPGADNVATASSEPISMTDQWHEVSAAKNSNALSAFRLLKMKKAEVVYSSLKGSAVISVHLITAHE
jgi:hypothetical protein